MRYGTLGGFLISGGFLFNNADTKMIKKILPNELIRMGSALITTASICINYRLQEVLQTDINACHRKASVKVGKLCAMNGGLYIKAAQHLASMDNLLPKYYTKELAKLQDQAPASSMKIIEQVFKEELGKDLNELFSDICDVPIGSASIGQVHLAKLRSTGEQVALKIQHPNIKTDAEIDLKSFKLALKIIKNFFPTVNLDWVIDELRSCLDSELNFKLEAENSKKARAAFEKDSKFKKLVLIPKVYDNLTTERVLTMEFTSGFKINDIEGMKAAGLDLSKVNSLMYQVFMEMIFKHNFVHCDPHPGNILINFDGYDLRIVLLDHGIYKIITSDVVMKFSRLFLAILGNDSEALSKISVEMNISVEILDEFRNLLKRMIEQLKKEHKSFDTDFLREELGKFIIKQPEAKKRQAYEALKSIPREFFYIIKVLDLLRSNERCLTRDNRQKFMMPKSLIIVTNHCLNHVEGQDPTIINSMLYFVKLCIKIFE